MGRGLLMKENTVEKRTFLDKFMDVVERACNKLPPPAILFCILFAIVAVLGAIFTALGTSLTNPATGEVVMSKNLFTKGFTGSLTAWYRTLQAMRRLAWCSV